MYFYFLKFLNLIKYLSCKKNSICKKYTYATRNGYNVYTCAATTQVGKQHPADPQTSLLVTAPELVPRAVRALTERFLAPRWQPPHCGVVSWPAVMPAAGLPANEAVGVFCLAFTQHSFKNSSVLQYIAIVDSRSLLYNILTYLPSLLLTGQLGYFQLLGSFMSQTVPLPTFFFMAAGLKAPGRRARLSSPLAGNVLLTPQAAGMPVAPQLAFWCLPVSFLSCEPDTGEGDGDPGPFRVPDAIC